MELLKTIWTSLTTENQLLIDLQGIPLTIIEITITMLLFTQILNINSTRRQKIIYVATFSFVALFSHFLISAPYNTFINTIANSILVFIIFKTNALKTIISFILPYAIFVILGSMVQIVYSLAFNIPTQTALSLPIHRLVFSIIMYLIAYLLYRLLKHFNIKITSFDNMHKNSLYILIINFIVGIIAITVQAYLGIIYIDDVPISILGSNILTLLIYFIISIYSLFRTNQLEITKKNLEDEKLYNRTLNILYDNLRVFKHDFNNIVQAIGGYVSTDNMNGLKKYYYELVDDCQRMNNLNILSPEIINNPAIYSLLTSKYHTADELGIKMNVDVFLDLTTLNIKTYELSKIFGILLDNAVEAANNCNEKIINVIIRKDPKVNRQLILIENTYTNKDINTDKIFEKGVSSKPDGDKKSHGLGLWEVRQILKRNNNLNLHTTKDEKFFSQQLEIYY